MLWIDSRRFGAAWPLDALGGELASWGVYALRASQAGQPAMDLRRADLSDLTVNFLANGKLDTAAAAAFYGATRVAVKTWYDQSGNGKHLTQATDNNKPGYNFPAQTPWPLVMFDPGSANYPVGLSNGQFRGFAMSPGLALTDTAGYTMYQVMLVRDRTSAGWTGPPKFGNSFVYGDNVNTTTLLATSTGAGSVGDGPAVTRLWRGGAWADIPVRGANLRPSVIVHRVSSGTPKNVFSSDLAHRSSATPANTFTHTITNIGFSGSFSSTEFGLLALVVYSGVHSDAQVATLSSLFHQRFGYSAMTYQLFFAGDSVTAGYDTTTLADDRVLSWPYQLVSTMALKTARAINVAVAGRTAVVQNDWDDVFVDLEFNAVYNQHVLVVALGSNDIITDGVTAATAYARIKTYCDNRRAAGWTKILVCTLIPRQNFTAGMETIRGELNGLIIANADGAWQNVANVAAQNWKPGGAGDWTTNYQDGIHPNAAGRTLFVNAVQPVLAALL